MTERLYCASCRHTRPRKCGIGKDKQAAGNWPRLGNNCRWFDYAQGSDAAEDAAAVEEFWNATDD